MAVSTIIACAISSDQRPQQHTAGRILPHYPKAGANRLFFSHFFNFRNNIRVGQGGDVANILII